MAVILSWIAGAILLGGFGLLALGRISVRAYNWINLLTAPPLAINSFVHGAFAPGVVEIVFGLFGATGLIWGQRD